MVDENQEVSPSFSISSVDSPVYARPDNSVIDCTVTVLKNGLDFGTHIYTAAAHDPEPHGQQLWDELVSGVHGPIAPYVAPPITAEQIQAQAQVLLDKIQTTYDITADSGLPWPEEWSAYRQMVRTVRRCGVGPLPKMPSTYPDGIPTS